MAACSGRGHLHFRRAPIPAEGHADQVGRFVPVPVFFSVTFVLHLLAGLLGSGVPVTLPVDHSQPENKHPASMEQHHFRPAPRQFRSKGRPGERGIVHEAAFIDYLEEVLKAALAFLFWGGEIHILSTHNGEANPFNRLCEDIRNCKQPGFLHKVTFNDAVADGIGKRSLEVQGKELTPESIKAWIDSIRHTYRHNAAKELDCIPSAGAGSWLTWEMIRGCQHSDAGRPELYMGGYCTIGIDVARSKHLWVASVPEDVAGV